MPSLSVVRESHPKQSARAVQARGIFDIPAEDAERHEWNIEYDLEGDWNVGLIVGPSGAGKSTVAREIFGAKLIDGWDWPENAPLLDGFSDDMTIQEVTSILSSVGFSSPPGWLKPFSALSNGEQFRVNLARTLAECPDLAVVDEFTSVIDRTVAKVGSTAVAKTVRRKGGRFVAVSCHYDIVDWLDPDWIIEPHTESFDRRRVRWGRPEIDVEIRRVGRESWELFKPHHYLTGSLHTAAKCWVALVEGRPAAFTSVIPYMGQKGTWRGHRSVCLPDFQGVGLGMKFVDYIASAVTGIGYKYQTSTTHPALIGARSRSPKWRMHRKPTLKSALQKKSDGSGLAMRLMASFTFVGEPMEQEAAQRIWDGK